VTIESIDRVFALNDGTDWLLLSVTVGGSPADSHTLYATSNSGGGEVTAGDFVEITGTQAQTDVVDVATDGTNVAYLRPDALLVHAGGVNPGSPPSVQTPPGFPGDSAAGETVALTGMIHESGGGNLWLADSNGRLYSSSNFGTSWADPSSQIQISSSDTAPLPFTDLGTVPVGEPSTGTTLLVGTNGYGYRIVSTSPAEVTAADIATLTTPDAETSNYQASDLAGAAVLFFYGDPAPVTGYPVPTAQGEPKANDGYLLFAGTSNAGLWRALSYEEPVQWVQE
jgi:hypothetical protein